MPGVDFHQLRKRITMRQVLDLMAFEPQHCRGDQWYGGCPWHDSQSHRPRHFSVNLASGRYYCHRCQRHGNQLELWAAFRRQPLYPASINLCQQLGIEVPWITRW